MASEFVRLKTGGYNDEHFAELIQALDLKFDFGADFSGDAIRKKRGYISDNYPLLYSNALKEAQRFATPPPLAIKAPAHVSP